MPCKDCRTRSNEGTTDARGARPGRAATSERCGAPLLALPAGGVGVVDGTLAQLARFGLAITGAPLLEPKREASEQCAGS